MALPNISSESEQMYLVTLAQLIEDGHEPPVPLPVLAQALGVQSASANQMVRRLCDLGLLHYEPYRGVSFTPVGSRLTRQILRFRRLWSTFLADHLGFAPVEADALACSLEHQTTPELGERLARYLDYPTVDPLGKPIPYVEGESIQPVATPLAELAVGEQARVVVEPTEPEIRAFLHAHGIREGSTVVVEGDGSSGMLLRAAEHRRVFVDRALAAHIRVVPVRGKEAVP